MKSQQNFDFIIDRKVRKKAKDLHFHSDTIVGKLKFQNWKILMRKKEKPPESPREEISKRKEMLCMRIDAYNQISQIYNTQNIMKTTKTQSARTLSDQVSISQIGHDYQIAQTAVSEASEIREDKVAQLKALIDSGDYKVEEGDFASKLLANYNAAL
jgi:negative regulator of flagellin synthesis FlgM